MVNSDLILRPEIRRKPRVCAVSYLNTAPLVWGAVHGPQKGLMDMTFAVPSICADRVVEGDADIGLVPAIEMARNHLDWIPLGIACRGPVRSILLISDRPFEQIRTLAVDSGSRTSVQLARIILARKYGVMPRIVTMDPDLLGMLDVADAALIIGDAALALDPAEIDMPCLDLGEEWVEMTGRPFVFAAWSGRKENLTAEITETLKASCLYGLGELDAIIKDEADRRGFSEDLVHQYLTRNICFLFGEEEAAGLELYLEYARALNGALETVTETRVHDQTAGSR
ncbi:menaquinone biosynthesis protein [uncultured Paludibaculum sp.]|uniref:menaquinone biosynthetic enzyme MqnA/MqnD family protein n=1 Tax=uncultured Paludibaculum sp. TaxID=1765020 RepID=UPI002AAB5F39|nr:menaquinone biosynthesis protein [uncultured Paludibaculum sp.]